MTHHPELPGLLEQFMNETGIDEQWVTVQELRDRFDLDASAGPAISGFLCKIHHGTSVSCRYRVVRMEKYQDSVPPYRIIKRYLVRERPLRNPAGSRTKYPCNEFR
nr:hypothetical protein [uncultured Methanoregula sp.]